MGTLIQPNAIPLELAILHARLKRRGWFWTYSWTPDGQRARTLHQSGGLSDRLDSAPESLPIYQIEELPKI